MKNIIVSNKKAHFDYHILHTLEAGIVLRGAEVKSIRARRANIKDSFVRIIKGEAFLFNAHIAHLETTNAHFKPDERATRKLLLHKKEINRLFGMVSQKGLTIVPLHLYINARNIVKLQIAVVQGKKLYDKRESLKQKTIERDIQTALKSRYK